MDGLYDEEIKYSNRYGFGSEVGGESQMDGMVEENGSSGPTSDPLATPPIPIATSVQSVIQANQQSVIQTATTGNLQPVLTKGNVILVSKPNSVIQTPQGQLQTLQVVVEAGSDDSLSNEEDASTKKHRQILSRRPSYRKILNDLGGQCLPQTYTYTPTFPFKSAKVESSGSDCDSNLDMIQTSALQLTPQGEVQGLHTLSMANNTTTGGTIVYTTAQGQDAEFYVPGEIVVTQNASSLPPGAMAEDQQRKREMRLLKNREAARECRRKKKEYIKCLENRVAVLENQNKALIDELKSLKELYCQTKAE